MKRKAIVTLIIGFAIVSITLIALLVPIGPLGLSQGYRIIGGRPDMGVLLANAKAAADSFLTRHKTEIGGGSFQLAADRRHRAIAMSLGYRSSFYYYCWDIYLPYSSKTSAGDELVILVHLSDATPGNGHDIAKFHVDGTVVLDGHGQIIKSL
jgi:hypothetical protein